MNKNLGLLTWLALQQNSNAPSYRLQVPYASQYDDRMIVTNTANTLKGTIALSNSPRNHFSLLLSIWNLLWENMARSSLHRRHSLRTSRGE